MRARHAASLLTLVAIAAVGCRSGSTAETTEPHATPTPAVARPSLGSKVRIAGTKANYHGMVDVSSAKGAKKVRIEIEDSYFAPTVIKGRPGQRITVSLENESQSPHTFTIAGTYIDLVLEPGKLAEVPVRFPRSGNLSFYCTYEKKYGMAGAFHVSGPLGKPGPTTTPRR